MPAVLATLAKRLSAGRQDQVGPEHIVLELEELVRIITEPAALLPRAVQSERKTAYTVKLGDTTSANEEVDDRHIRYRYHAASQ